MGEHYPRLIVTLDPRSLAPVSHEPSEENFEGLPRFVISGYKVVEDKLRDR